MSSNRPLPNWFPLFLLGLTLAAIFHRLLLGDVLFWGLPSLQFYPWRDFAMSELAQGRLPLWNPYNGAGAPLLANYQSALLYPPHLLYFVWSGPQMMGFLGLLHLFWAGLGMWALTGRLQIPVLGRGIATLAYPLSTTLVARFGTFPMVDTAAWLPWLILTIDALIERISLFRLLSLAGVVAMQLLAGHAQWTFYSFVLAGGYGLWRVIGLGRIQAARILAGALVAIVLGIGLTAAQLLPTAELQRESQRSAGVDEDFALNFSYAPLSLITLFNPNFFGNPGDGGYVIGGAYFETTAYIGILPVVLAILGTAHYVLARRHRTSNISSTIPHANLIPFFTLVAIIAVLLAFGKFFIYPLLYRYVPTFKLFQAPSRWLLLAVFALSMLAAFAIHAWKPDRRTRSRARLALVSAASVLLAGFVAQTFLPGGTPIVVQMTQGITALGVLLLITMILFATQPMNARYQRRWMIAVLLFVAADLWWANSLSNPSVPASFYDKRPPVTTARLFWYDAKNSALPEVAFERFLPLKDYRVAVAQQEAYRQSNLPNLNLLDRQPSLNNFDPLRPEGFERFMKLLNKPMEASWQISFQNAAAVGPVSPRVWMSPEAIHIQNADEAEKMLNLTLDVYRKTFVEGTFNMLRSRNAGTAKIVQETPLDLTIAVESPEGGALVVADTYYPGWTATLDGVPTPIYRANIAFRAMIMPAGNHEVRMVYQPQSFRVGAVISLVSLAIYGMLIGVAFMRRRLTFLSR